MLLWQMFYSLLNLFLPDDCITSLIEDKWINGPCLKIFITKGLGYAIILGSVLVKVPQILKIWNAGNSEGLSLIGVLLELTAMVGTLCYSIANKFPFSSYGESFFMVLQQSIIFFFVLLYNYSLVTAVSGYTVFVGVVSILLSPVTPLQLLFLLQTSVIFLLLASRLSQAYSNYNNESTGQLSLISVLLQWLGSLARVFTTLSEVGDTVTVLMFVASCTTNGILLIQIWYYWDCEMNKNNNTPPQKAAFGRHNKAVKLKKID